MDGTAEFPCNAHRRQRQQTNCERFRMIEGTENKQSYTLTLRLLMSYIYRCPKKIVPFFIFFFLGAQCVESGVSCTDCY